MYPDSQLYYSQAMPDFHFPIDIFQKYHPKPGVFLKTHWHEHLQFMFFTAGSALIRCNAKPFRVAKGDFIVINSHELHDGENLETDLSYYVIRIDFPFLRSYQEDTCNIKYIQPLCHNRINFRNWIQNDAQISEYVLRMVAEYDTREIGYELAVKALAYQLLVVLLRQHVSERINDTDYRRRLNALNQLGKVLNYLEENYNEKITIAQLSRMLDLSCSHFCRLFKKYTGESAIDYLNQLRIRKAVSLLQETTLSITEIALITGFNDVNYFSRLFKAYRNHSPSEVRKTGYCELTKSIK